MAMLEIRPDRLSLFPDKETFKLNQKGTQNFKGLFVRSVLSLFARLFIFPDKETFKLNLKGTQNFKGLFVRSVLPVFARKIKR